MNNIKQPLTRSEINKRYRIRNPDRFKEQNRRAYLKRKARFEAMKEIELLNEVLQADN
jgi:hypothetical protein